MEKIGDEIRDISDEIPFDIPESWEWVRFCNVVSYSMGKTPPRKDAEYWNDPVHNWVSIADMIADGHISTTKEAVSEYAADVSFRGRKSPVGTLLMSFKLTVGKVSILDIEAYHNEAIISIYPFIDDDKIMTSYLFAVMPLLSQLGETKTAIKGNTLNSDSLDNLWIPLPPLKEQARICKKIKELVPILNDYTKAEQATELLNTTFPTQLKKSILQQAVQGKLVPQNPDDEPASVLLERIRAEKQELIKTGKIKKDKNESVIVTRDKIPYEIPDGWVWCKLSHICQSITDGDHQPPPQVPNGKPFIVISNVSAGKIDFSNTRYVPEEYYNSLDNNRKPIKNDILFTVTGSYGIVMKVKNDREFCFQRHIALLKPLFIDSDFLVHWLRTPFVYEQCKETATGTAQKTVSLTSLKNIIIPLPPLSEQRRIVTKIEELLPIINHISK